jgi:hypothetical protein
VKKLIAIATLAFSTACAGNRVVKPDPVFSGDRVVEARELPPPPELAKNFSGFSGEETQIEGISKGDPAPFDGIVSSEKRAALDGQYRISYKELRSLYTADRKEWTVQRMLYEQQIVAATVKIQELQPSWFDQHKIEIGFLGGFVLGVTGTILIVTH